MSMDRIVVIMDHAENRRHLVERLAGRYSVLPRAGDGALDEMFDLGILDGAALERLGGRIEARRGSEDPVFLPFVLATARGDVGLATRHLWKCIDEVIAAPIDPLELQARVEVLLRARRQSLALRARNEAMEALLSALTHEVRAPLRAISEFVGWLLEGQAGRLDALGRHHLERVRWNSELLRRLVESLTDFFRLGHEPIELRMVQVRPILDSCLSHCRAEIEARQAEVTVEGPSPLVRADPRLLKIAVRNLLTNALKYVAPGVAPRITITVGARDGHARIEVADNGIGIAPADRERIFEAFVRLHGEEEYPGIGLGLAVVRRAVMAMGGRLGVDSSPGRGSTFWMELEREESS